jgi:hypothetical protein
LEELLAKPDLTAFCFNADIAVPRSIGEDLRAPPFNFPSLTCTLLALLSLYDHQMLPSMQLPYSRP